MVKVATPEPSNIVNHIGHGTIIKGDITTDNDIRMDGILNGNLSTKGKLVIGETGGIRGEVICKSAVVSGKIEGKIKIEELISLKETAQLKGDILSQKIQVEPGAILIGTCNVGSSRVESTGGANNERPESKEDPKKNKLNDL